MSDQPTLLDAQHVRRIVHEEVAAAIKAALADVPTRAEMKSYVDDRISASNKETNVLIKSVDEHLRVSEFSNGKTREALERLAGTLDTIAPMVKASAAHLDNLQHEVTENAEDILNVSDRITRTHNAIFGDPDTPGVISLVESFNQRRSEANEQFATTNRRLEELMSTFNQRIVPLESYVISHRQFEQRIVNTFRWFVNHPRVTITLVGVIGSGLSIDAIQRLLDIIMPLVNGITTP